MTTAEILHQLERVPERAEFAPYAAALEAAIAQRETITPELIAIVERACAEPDVYFDDLERADYHFAIYLLAHFRETRARDAVCRFVSLPGKYATELVSWIEEIGAVILASVCGGDSAALLELIHNEAVDENVRAEAIDALTIQSFWNERPRDAVIADLREIFLRLARPGNPWVWSRLVTVVLDFPAPELADEAREVIAEDLPDEVVTDPQEFEDEMARISSGGPVETPTRPARFDVLAECSIWANFQPDADEPNFDLPRLKNFAADTSNYFAPSAALPNEPIEPGAVIATGATPFRAPAKIGRNDPCPCGSGKKHKKCCGKN